MRQDQVESILKPYEKALVQCVTQGWQTWRDLQGIDAAKTAPIKTRTRANFVSDHIADEARRIFSGNPNVIISETHQTLLLSIEDLISVRFKKLDEKGKTRNIRTRRQRKVWGTNLELPGFAAMRVSIGYMLNPLQTEIADIRVVYELGIASWYYSLIGNGAIIMDEMVLDQPLETSIAPIVRAKQQSPKSKTGNE